MQIVRKRTSPVSFPPPDQALLTSTGKSDSLLLLQCPLLQNIDFEILPTTAYSGVFLAHCCCTSKPKYLGYRGGIAVLSPKPMITLWTALKHADCRAYASYFKDKRNPGSTQRGQKVPAILLQDTKGGGRTSKTVVDWN